MWFRWRPVFDWDILCPIVFADPFGFIVVMLRANQPVTLEEVVEADPDYYPDITSEMKANDFGRIGAHIVAIDYGLFGADNVDKQRAYYLKQSQDLGNIP